MFAVPAAAAAPVSLVISTNRSFATEREEDNVFVFVAVVVMKADDVFNRIALTNANACDVTFIIIANCFCVQRNVSEEQLNTSEDRSSVIVVVYGIGKDLVCVCVDDDEVKKKGHLSPSFFVFSLHNSTLNTQRSKNNNNHDVRF